MRTLFSDDFGDVKELVSTSVERFLVAMFVLVVKDLDHTFAGLLVETYTSFATFCMFSH